MKSYMQPVMFVTFYGTHVIDRPVRYRRRLKTFYMLDRRHCGRRINLGPTAPFAWRVR